MKKVFFIFIFLSTLIAVSYPQQSQLSKEKKEILEIQYENAQIVDHPVLGVLILSNDRWKNWIVRSFIVVLIFVTFIVLNLSLAKNTEANIIISYFLNGAMFTVSYWTTLCGWMLTRLNKNLYGLGFIALSLIMYVVTYILTMKTKKSDISFATLKESFQKLAATKQEDKRLAPISGLPGDWLEEDLVR